ncbi:MAG: hypothetical protein M3Z23_10815 [Acidobacteriota bacterium]|nr:hypothetical protein [Acidobacteriota bacterium]
MLIFALAAVSAFADSVPRQSPEFAIQMSGGGQTLLSSYKGKVVVVAFLFTT